MCWIPLSRGLAFTHHYWMPANLCIPHLLLLCLLSFQIDSFQLWPSVLPSTIHTLTALSMARLYRYFLIFPSVCSKQIKIYLNSGTWHWGWIIQSSGSAQQQKQICRQTFVDRSLFKTLYFIKMECFYPTKSIQCRNNIDAGMHTCMHHLDSAVFPSDLLWLCCDFWFSKI